MFNVSTPMQICALVWEIFLVHVGESFSARGGIIPIFVLTVQMYGILIAVHERLGPLFFVFSDFFQCRGHDCQSHDGQNRKSTVKFPHYNINILFIYSEQITTSRNRK
jgi:hypothetical protein